MPTRTLSTTLIIFTILRTMRNYRHVLTWLLPLLASLCFSLPFLKRSEFLFPGFMSTSYTYGDNLDGGESRTDIHVERGTLVAHFHLSDKHPTPYTGFGFGLTDAAHPYGRDFSGYDRIELVVRSNRLPNLGFNMITWIPGFTTENKSLSGKFMEATTTIGPVYSKVSVPLSLFSEASWWPQVSGLGANTAPLRLDMVKNLEIRMPVAMIPARRDDTLEFKSVRMVGYDWRLLAFSTVAALLVSLGISLWSRSRTRTAQPSTSPGTPERNSAIPEIGQIVDGASKIELPNRRDLELQSLLNWIKQNYHKEEIGVDDAARGSGVSVRRIPQLLKDHSGKSFPAYIASIRLGEACRLLRETDRQVSEISLAVGFSNTSHFHRVFKNETGDSPVAWREKAKASSGTAAIDT